MRHTLHREFRFTATGPRLVHGAIVALLVIAALAAPLAVAEETLASVSRAASASA